MNSTEVSYRLALATGFMEDIGLVGDLILLSYSKFMPLQGWRADHIDLTPNEDMWGARSGRLHTRRPN